MIAALGFLVMLDAIIISATPDTTRMAFAALVTIVVGFTIAKIWRSNTEFEEAASTGTKAAQKSESQRSERLLKEK